jgi:uncharacterized protein YlxW (UPF0749 family)
MWPQSGATSSTRELWSEMTDETNEPERQDPAASEGGRGKRHSLTSMLTGRPGGAQIVVAVLLAALGFAAVVQVRLTQTDSNFGGARRGDLVELLDSLSGAADRAQQQIGELQQTRTDLLSASRRQQAAVSEERTRLSVLQILTGTVGAVGPGVTVTIDDPDSAVTAPILLNGIDELRDAGAEVIELNNSVRVVASTSIVQHDGVLVADGTELHPPYLIDVIGSSHTLADAVVFPGGLSDEVEHVGGTTSVHEAEVVKVDSLHTVVPPEYSQPTR